MERVNTASQARTPQDVTDESISTSTYPGRPQHSNVKTNSLSQPTEIEAGKPSGAKEHRSFVQKRGQPNGQGAAYTSTVRNQALSPSSKHLVNGRTNGIRDQTEDKGIESRNPSLIQDQSPQRVRRYTKFDNPQTTWFCGGYLMTGGDSLLSVALAIVVMFGLTGVWLGTTGVWLWKHGSKYGLVKGGGIVVVIILVSVIPCV